MQKKLLVTGFDPFGGEKINPAWEAVKLLPDIIGNYEIHKLMIPTVFGAAPKAVIAKALEIRPNAVISVGQAGGRKAVTPERIGITLTTRESRTTRATSPRTSRFSRTVPTASSPPSRWTEWPMP